MLMVLTLAFLGINEVYAFVGQVLYPIDYEMYLDGKLLLNGDLVKVRPGSSVSVVLVPTRLGSSDVISNDSPGAPKATVGIKNDSVNQMNNRINLFYSPTIDTLYIRAPRTADDSVVQDTISIQLESTIPGASGSPYYSALYDIRVQIVDDGKGEFDRGTDGGGTCNAVGLGSLGLLVPFVFLRKRK